MYPFSRSQDQDAPRDETDETDDTEHSDSDSDASSSPGIAGEADGAPEETKEPWFDQALFQFPNGTDQITGKLQGTLPKMIHKLVRDGLLTDKDVLALLEEPYTSMAQAAIVQFRQYVQVQNWVKGSKFPCTQQATMEAAGLRALRGIDVKKLRRELDRLKYSNTRENDSDPRGSFTEEQKETAEEKKAQDSGDGDNLQDMRVSRTGQRPRRCQTSFASYFFDQVHPSGETTGQYRREPTESKGTQVDRFLQDLVNRGHLRHPFPHVHTFQIHPALVWDESPYKEPENKLDMAKRTLYRLLKREEDRNFPMPPSFDIRMMAQTMDKLAL